MTGEPLPRRSGTRLSPAQRDMLATLARYSYGEGKINPRGERTASVLKRHGLIARAGSGGWVRVTDAGLAVLEETDGS